MHYMLPFKINIISTIFIILRILFKQILANDQLKYFDHYLSNITLKIKGNGTRKVLSSSFDKKYYPNITYINDERQSIVNYTYNFNKINNIVKLIWYDSIDDCHALFHYCPDIIEIDLSDFDTKNVVNMELMFYGCNSLTSLNLNNFNTSSVTNMGSIFCNCNSLSSINLSNFNTSNVINMGGMFYGCSSLTSLNLSTFDTSKVASMRYMFHICRNLSSIDLSNFDTSNVSDMYSMFRVCPLLTSLDLSNFNTSKVENMDSMFLDCSLLTSLNLLNFDTSRVINMNYMFQNCKSLITLDLSNFDFSNVTSMNHMFSGCTNLEYINLKNFFGDSLSSFDNIFNSIPDNIVICLNERNYKILSELNNKSCYSLYCSEDWEKVQKKIVNKTGICNDNTNNDIFYKYEFNGKYYESCNNQNLTNNTPIKNCNCDKEKCLSCPSEPLVENLCKKCNNVNGYYEIEKDNSTIIEGNIQCEKEPIGYYLDKNDYKYKKCYYSCEICEKGGDNLQHNCLKCNENYSYEVKVNNQLNCYINCSYYHYFDINNNYHCSLNSYCPDEYPKLIPEKMECIKNNDIKNIIEDIKNKFEKNGTKEISQEEKIEYYDSILKKLEESITSDNYDTTDLDNGKDELVETGKMKITITTTQNQKNSINDNMTNIDLGECEILLRNFYNLSNKEILYIKKLDIIQEGMKIPKIEYEVYSKLRRKNLVKLNLTICQKSKIDISIPIIIKESLDKFNTCSGYFNDLCYITTSDSGTDISLKDRKNEFIENNRTVCQEDCNFSEYNYTSQKAKCSCRVQNFSNSIVDMNINKTKLLENFKNIKNVANLNFLICHKTLFSKKGILYNIGCYLIIVIMIFKIISFFVFYIKQFDFLKNKINNIIFAKINWEPKKKGVKINIQQSKQKENNFFMKVKKIKNKNKLFNVIKENNNIISSKKIKKKQEKSKNKLNKKHNSTPIDINSYDNNINNNKINNKKNYQRKNKFTNIMSKVNSKPRNKTTIENGMKIIEYNDDELNSLSYNLALCFDKRSYCVYYISLLKTKHILISSFCYNEDYNSKLIKIDLFFMGFTIYYTVNALFFNDDTMHNIYISKGSFYIEYQLPKIVYSSLISLVLNTLLKLLGLTNDGIINFKQNKGTKNIKQEGKKLINKVTIKFIFYFILSFTFLIFFWYYVSMFGAIYRNTQYHLLIDTLISFGLSLLYPLGIYLIPGFFRIHSLSDPKINREYLYKFSKILQLF